MSEPGFSGLQDSQDYLDDGCYFSVPAFLLDQRYGLLRKNILQSRYQSCKSHNPENPGSDKQRDYRELTADSRKPITDSRQPKPKGG